MLQEEKWLVQLSSQTTAPVFSLKNLRCASELLHASFPFFTDSFKRNVLKDRDLIKLRILTVSLKILFGETGGFFFFKCECVVGKSTVWSPCLGLCQGASGFHTIRANSVVVPG